MPDGDSAMQDTTANAEAAATSRLPSLAGAPALRLSGDDVRMIVLDYLTHSTYIDTAVSFVKDWDGPAAGPSGTNYASGRSALTSDGRPANYADADEDMADGHSDDPDTTIQVPSDVPVDVMTDGSYRNGVSNGAKNSKLTAEEIQLIRVRKEIRRLVQQGLIQPAIELCNAHFPFVLDPTRSTPTMSRQASTPSTPRGGHSRGVTQKASTSSLSSFAAPSPASLVFPTSPALLSLSLQIQLFIEVVRSSSSSANGLSRPSTPFSQGQSPGSGNGSLEGSTASLASDRTGSSHLSGASGMSTSTNGSTSAIQVALLQAQNLHAQASRLQDPVQRAVYLKELETVSGLLPYHDPRASPVAYYLDERRRDALADAINGAILLSLGHTSTTPKLVAVVRQNEHVWRTLNDLKATYPPEKGSSKGKAPKPIQTFDMQEFLDTTLVPGA